MYRKTGCFTEDALSITPPKQIGKRIHNKNDNLIIQVKTRLAGYTSLECGEYNCPTLLRQLIGNTCIHGIMLCQTIEQ